MYIRRKFIHNRECIINRIFVMGITTLETIVNELSVKVYNIVHIPELVNDHKTKTGEIARIVVDTRTCKHVSLEFMDNITGYGVEKFVRGAQALVGSFKELNVELVFFIARWNLLDGRDHQSIMRRVVDYCSGKESSSDSFEKGMPNKYLTMAWILKYALGCEVHMNTGNYRRDIITYVKNRKCFAILSEDMEFLASQVDTIVLSSKHLSLKAMRTLCYYREKLALELGIHIGSLPLFAIMCANDSILHETSEGLSALRLNITLYINRLSQNENMKTILTNLATDQLKDASLAESLQKSFCSYFVASPSEPSSPTDEWSKILQVAKNRYQDAVLPYHAYSVMNDQEFPDTLTVNSRRDSSVRFQLYVLRARLYGILLSEKVDNNASARVTVLECIHGDDMEITSIKPTKPEVPYPGLMELWSDNDAINEKRWALFLWAIYPNKLKVAEWQSFDEELLLVTLSTYYLYESNYITKSELVAILTTVATYPLYNGMSLFVDFFWYKLSISKKDHSRADEIIVALNRTFALVLNVLAACGYPLKLSENNAYLKFEGRIFQFVYINVIEKTNSNIKSLFKNNDNCIKAYKRMREMIIGKMDDGEVIDGEVIDGEVNNELGVQLYIKKNDADEDIVTIEVNDEMICLYRVT